MALVILCNFFHHGICNNFIEIYLVIKELLFSDSSQRKAFLIINIFLIILQIASAEFLTHITAQDAFPCHSCDNPVLHAKAISQGSEKEVTDTWFAYLLQSSHSAPNVVIVSYLFGSVRFHSNNSGFFSGNFAVWGSLV